ncbi:MAG: DUF4245 domain-containing protein [Microbacterium sp.]|nr:DUF4245 domain-containing protein [Microbacterium sp.]MBA4345100.1 DUF4245 domain-containing protein [Microbacterium sp.]
MTNSPSEPGAETPQQKADRIAEARRTRRANQTVRNLIGSLIASLAIVLFLVLVVVRPDPAPLTVDYLAAAAEAEASLGTAVIAPIVPPTWSANRAELAGSGGVDEWAVGFITENRTFLGLLQGFTDEQSWLRDALRDPGEGESVRIAGVEWQRYDRRGVEGVGLREIALVTSTADSTVVLYGTASDADLEVLANAVAAELPAAD